MADNLMIQVDIDSKKLDAQLKQIQNKFSKTKVNVGGVDNLAKSTKKATDNMDLLGNSFLSAISKFSQWYVIGRVVSDLSRLIEGMFEHVSELDASLTEMSFTFNFTEESMNNLVIKDLLPRYGR